jgi:hypothetical protein
MAPRVLCVVGTEVRGGAQKLEVECYSMGELLGILQRRVEFTVGNPVVDAVSLFDNDFAEYVLVKDVSEIPIKAKVKVTLAPPGSAAQSPSKHPQPPTGAAFYSDVCDSVLLPAIEELTGTSAASLSALLSEAYVKNPDDPHNPLVSRLASTIHSSVQRSHDQEVQRFQASLAEKTQPQPQQQQPSRRDPPPAAEPEPVEARRNKSARKSAPPANTAPEQAAPSPVAASVARSSATAPTSPAPAPAPSKAETAGTLSPESIVAYCVYNGVGAQRAKAVRISRYKPSLKTLLSVLKDKFRSDLSLGYIEPDGTYSELLLDEDLEAVVSKIPPNIDSVTFHCWTQAPAEALELAYCTDISSRAKTPSGKSVASAVSAYSATSTARKSARPGSALSTRSESKKKPKKSKSMTNPLDVSGQCYSEEQLRELFDELDIDDNGYLDKEEMRKLFFERYDPMGVADAEKIFEGFLQQCGAFDDNKITYDEFAIVMLKLAQW